MQKRIILATILGAAIAFAWGFASWTVFSWHTPEKFANEEVVAKVIKENANTHGQYMLPASTGGEPNMDAIQRGPFIYATVRPGKLEGWTMAKAMILNYAVCLFLALILAIVMMKRSHYVSKLTVGILFGLFAGITASLPHMIWMELPPMETVARLCDPIISWTLAAAAMANIVKRPKRRIFSS